ncbi:FAD-dependent oxidoreductase [Enterococcus sp. JM9B]|uniref:FAD-dependent oxidoreductase n=1 Tax=Enterococcus sp. JM9B TaxID=1857216 RepID=UPI00192A4A69|nr:FAD-dependent oxidoreductase [Enterococcus sp. JM9B]KAF1300822.1 FAD-dependent oxidoreductase [Enterococcus sp. JM9B]
MNVKMVEKNYELVVVGGGLSGVCAAISAAREGIKTVLIHNRPVLGGNASSEVKMHICGADNHMNREDARETGLIEEVLLENKYRNASDSFSIFDVILWEKARYQENLDLYLNTQMYQVVTEKSKIVAIKANQQTTEKEYTFYGNLFVDGTGDGTLGYLAGAEYMSGREGKDVFGEKIAPDESDGYTMGSSIQFTSKDIGRPVKFQKPAWAYSYTEEDLQHRKHTTFKDGYWWLELGGDEQLNTIADAEKIRDELLKVVYGVWDHIKNGGDHGAENYELDWIGFLPGKRESRRFIGDYVLTANDLEASRQFEDVIAYGGWPMDIHVVGGMKTNAKPTINYYLNDLYDIPYRVTYSKNIDNLYLAGRLISASHCAFGSTRVMATCAVIGEAIGLAASLAQKYDVSPRIVGQSYLAELQQLILKKDLYLPNLRNNDVQDLALQASVTASSTKKSALPKNVINGVARPEKGTHNYWESRYNTEEWLALNWAQPVNVQKVNIKFDSNLSQEVMLSLSEKIMKREDTTVQRTLVKDFDLEFYYHDELVRTIHRKDNYLRNGWIELNKPIKCTQVKVVFHSTNGCPTIRVFEVRIY